MCIDFIGHCLCNQGLAGAEGSVEQYSFRGLDSQALKDLGMPERELDHLADKLQLPALAPDIFIMDIGDLPHAVFGFVGPSLVFDLGLIGDDRNSLGGDCGDHERDRVADYIHADGRAFHHGPAAQDPRKVLLTLDKLYRLGGLNHHFLGINRLGFLNLHPYDTTPGIVMGYFFYRNFCEIFCHHKTLRLVRDLP